MSDHPWLFVLGLLVGVVTGRFLLRAPKQHRETREGVFVKRPTRMPVAPADRPRVRDAHIRPTARDSTRVEWED